MWFRKEMKTEIKNEQTTKKVDNNEQKTNRIVREENGE